MKHGDTEGRRRRGGRVRRQRRWAARRGGQTMIFLLALVVILAVIVLWNFDLHRIVTVKLRSQHAGDAAALAAARWQGISLNLIGHLNVLQAVAVSDALARGETEFPEAEALAELRARLAFAGPMTAFAASQQAARQNGLFNRESFTRTVQRHAVRVRTEYPGRFTTPPYRNRPSPPTAWDDYAGMIEAVAADGVVAMPDNARFYADYRHRDHLLLNPDFYDAIASGDWCWFFFHARGWLEQYQSWQDWGALPEIEEQDPTNAEYFSLGLRPVRPMSAIPPGPTGDLLDELRRRTGRPITSAVAQVAVDWTCYDPRTWSSWTDALPEGFPFAGRIRPEADVAGADAAVRTETVAERVSPGGGRDVITWSAAAKPFGALDSRDAPHRFGLVLPAFRDVRLIPVDSAAGGAPGSRPGWHEHIYEHVPAYVRRGLDALDPGCWYCRQLRTWEQDEFRQGGREWLDRYSDTCRRPGPGAGPGGGSRRGH